MMAAANRSKILSLYKSMLRESQKFTSYNFRLSLQRTKCLYLCDTAFRSYAIRRIRDAFKEHRGDTDPAHISDLLKFAEENLKIIQRQVVLGQMYKEPLPHTMEGMKHNS